MRTYNENSNLITFKCYHYMEHKQISTLAKNIRRLRLQKGWSQDELARKTDIPFTTLTKIETGVIKKPSVFTVEQIAAALDISVDDLLK